MLKNKRGGIFSIIYLMAFLAIVAILGLFFYYLSHEVSLGFDDVIEGEANTGYASEVNQNVRGSLSYFFDELIFFLFLGSAVALIIAAARTNFSPLVIGIFILLTLISIFLASGFTNIYQGFAQTEGLNVISGRLTLTNIIFSKYTPLIIMVLSAVVLIVMYGKSGGNIIK